MTKVKWSARVSYYSPGDQGVMTQALCRSEGFRGGERTENSQEDLWTWVTGEKGARRKKDYQVSTDRMIMNGEEKVKQDLGVGRTGGGDNDIALRSVNRKFLVLEIIKAVAAHVDFTRGPQTMACGLNLGHCLFCMNPQNRFCIFMYVREKKKKEYFATCESYMKSKFQRQ